jgi:hypothetical protein
MLITENFHCMCLYQYTSLQKLHHPSDTFTINDHISGGTIWTLCSKVSDHTCREVVDHLNASWILDPKGPSHVNLYSAWNKICRQRLTELLITEWKNINVTYSIFNMF